MDSVVHFEMAYENRDRMTKFYETAFGWETHALGPDMWNYVIVRTTETGPDRMAIHPGAINGGFHEKPSDPVAQAPSVVIAVMDVREAMQKITAAGGRLLTEPMEIPGVGQYVSFLDTEGNRASILQPLAPLPGQ
ncbi:MAG TPA: VOC family protein [Thermoanaerobaculia bacterium]|nr:VOC family protein [Thermoanaerobaculia bacterium]